MALGKLKNDNFLYLYTFLSGMISFSIKLFSLKTIIEMFALENYFLIMAFTGAGVFLLNSGADFFKRTKKFRANFFFLFILLILTAPKFLFELGLPDFALTGISCLIFISSIVIINRLDVLHKEVINSHVSILRNSKIVTRLSLTEQAGILVAALSQGFMAAQYVWADQLVQYLPLAALFCLVLKANKSVDADAGVSEDLADEKKFFSETFNYAFVKYAILFFASVLAIKQIFHFSIFLGIGQLSQEGASIEKSFATLNIIQTLMIFTIFSLKIGFQKDSQVWSSGAKTYLNGAGLIFAGLFFASSPVFILLANSARKTLNHCFLSDSMKLLNSNFPEHVRKKINLLMYNYANLSSYIFISFLAFLTINQSWSLIFLWATGLALTLGALFLRKNLFNKLSEFHVSNLVKNDVYGAVNACYSLSTPESKIYASSLCNVLHNNPRPILTKSIIHALGQINHPLAIDELIQQYRENKREDIQLAIINSLIKFKSYKVDLFLYQCLVEIIVTQVSLGEIRRTIFQNITGRIYNIASPLILDLIDKHKDDSRVLANAALILGELSLRKKSPELDELLFSFTDKKHARRIRSNAIIYLYKKPHYRQKCVAIMANFLTSRDEHDKSAASFLAGELKLKGMLPFVIENSRSGSYQNSTQIIALLKLGYPPASRFVADYIMNSKEADAITCLNQLNSIEESGLRYKVYFEVLNHFSSELERFMKLLSDTNRDFDHDRRVIKSEANRMGLEIQDGNFLFFEENDRKTPKIKKAA